MLSLVPFTEVFFHCSGRWLGDPELMHLIDASPISEENRRVWFEALPQKSNYKIWGVALDDRPIGVAGLKNIHNNKAEYFGYIGDKSSRGNGYGHLIIKKIEQEAILSEIDTLFLKVIFENYVAINLYFKEGYKIFKILDDRLYYMEKYL